MQMLSQHPIYIRENLIARPDAELFVDHLKSPDIQQHNGIGAGCHVL